MPTKTDWVADQTNMLNATQRADSLYLQVREHEDELRVVEKDLEAVRFLLSKEKDRVKRLTLQFGVMEAAMRAVKADLE